MKLIKNIFLIFLIIIVLYIVSLFVFTEKTKDFWDSIWLKSFNEIVLKLKWKVDEVSEIKPDEVKDKFNEVLDTWTNYAKDIKSKIDWVRSTAQWVENTYNEVKTQIDETTKNIQEIGNKINEAKQSFDNVTNIIN